MLFFSIYHILAIIDNLNMKFRKDIQDDISNHEFPKIIKEIPDLLPLPLLQIEKINKQNSIKESIKNKKIEKENDNNEEESIFQYFE